MSPPSDPPPLKDQNGVSAYPHSPPEPPPASRADVWLARQVDAFGRMARHPLFWVGAREMAGVAVGMMAWSFMVGVAMVRSGMSLTEAALMQILVYAGSAQLAAIPLIAAGAPMLVIWVAAFCVNLRFVVFSLHLRDYLMFLPRGRRLALGYFCGDSIYVLYTRRFARPAATPGQRRAHLAYLMGSNTINWLFWEASGLAGVFAGNALPARWGLEFAGTLALLALTVSLTTSKLRGLSAILAGAAALAAFGLPWKLNIVAAVVVAVALSLYLEPKEARHA
jgi:predicted branched-subunit amino acid permease